uniref:Glutaredoxin-1 n=1 Tax=Gallus gallus TaxID=9031 RepID=A0A8V0YB63_CHICK
MVDSFVQSKLRDNKVTLFVKGSCPYCKNAIALLKEFNFLPGCLEVVDITGMDDIQDYFQKTTGQRTEPGAKWSCSQKHHHQTPDPPGVPRVFIGTKCIGGFSDLQKMEQQLPMMLRQIGALV